LLLAREGRFAEAVPLYRLAIASYLKIGYAPQGPTIAEARPELAASLIALGQREEARALIARAGPIVESELAPTHPARIMLARLRAALRARSPAAATIG
jgi:tetratricopeptide (TPR) repeat protein